MTMRLAVAGACLRGDGYPNAAGTLAALRASADWEVEDHAHWLPEGIHLWRAARGPWSTRLRLLATLFGGSARSLLRVLRRAGPAPLVYAPYPAVFTLLWVSMIPPQWRPRVVADAYISMWDAMFRDRASGTGSLAARILCWAEGRALRAAHAVIVDTEANRAWMVEAFRLAPTRVHAMPLAIDAAPYLALAHRPAVAGRLRVLFIGTLIPLHGVGVIAGAMRLLGPDAGIEFEFIGDGQEAPVLEQLEADDSRAPLRWQRAWASPAALAQAIATSDVCLGVFGGAGKAGRVLPFKLYLALAAGRAIVTQAQHSLPEGASSPPWHGIDPRPEALAQALLRMRDRPAERDALATAAREYYLSQLNAATLAKRWRVLVDAEGR